VVADRDGARRRLAAARFGVLAATVLLTIGAIMIAAPLVHGRVRPQVLVSLPIAVGLYVVSGSLRLVTGVALAMVAVGALGVISAANQATVPLVLDMGLRAGVIALITGWLTVEVARESRVSLDTILGGISVYLLIAFLYAHAYLILHLVDAGSLLSNGRPLDPSVDAQHPFRAVPDLVYFSYATLTTVAYGDITPATPVARFVAMTEGMVGQLFPTIFIARLVSLNIAQRREAP